MNESLPALLALQQIDSALALAARQYQALDEGRAEQAAAETAIIVHERLVRSLHETEGDLKDAELEQQGVEKKKKDFESKLYGGRVTNPKELMDMQHEIEALGRQAGRLDERILTLMEQLETRRAQEQDARSKRELAEAAQAVKQAQYKKASRALTARIKSLQAERTTHAAAVVPALLARYESIRKPKGGVGIGKIEERTCTACHTQLSLNLIRSVQDTDRIEICENCGRLLIMEA